MNKYFLYFLLLTLTINFDTKSFSLSNKINTFYDKKSIKITLLLFLATGIGYLVHDLKNFMKASAEILFNKKKLSQKMSSLFTPQLSYKNFIEQINTMKIGPLWMKERWDFLTKVNNETISEKIIALTTLYDLEKMLSWNDDQKKAFDKLLQYSETVKKARKIIKITSPQYEDLQRYNDAIKAYTYCVNLLKTKMIVDEKKLELCKIFEENDFKNWIFYTKQIASSFQAIIMLFENNIKKINNLLTIESILQYSFNIKKLSEEFLLCNQDETNIDILKILSNNIYHLEEEWQEFFKAIKINEDYKEINFNKFITEDLLIKLGIRDKSTIKKIDFCFRYQFFMDIFKRDDSLYADHIKKLLEIKNLVDNEAEPCIKIDDFEFIITQ